MRGGKQKPSAQSLPQGKGILPIDLITVGEVAEMLRISCRSVERLVQRRELGCYHLPLRTGLRFSKREVIDWIATRRLGR
jgi:excisionase family DNA binding protein